MANATGYWAAPAEPVPGAGGLAPVPPPAGRRAGAPTRLVLLLTVLGLVAAAAIASQVRASADVGEVRAVTTDATAEQGWGPTYVDENGKPGRWDPCTAIPYVVQTRWAPEHGRRDLAEALRRLSAASGLRFLDEGDTDEVPSTQRRAYQPERYGERWAPLVVGWVPPGATDVGLGDGVQGVSLTVAVGSKGGPSLVSGQVALNADNRLASGFGPGTTDGEVLLHELTHAVGLGHVLDPTQLMYPQTTSSESAFGAGDRAGLAAVGAPAGCHPAPPARTVRFAP